MSVFSVLLLAAVVPLASFAPGFFLVRRLRGWGPLEKLVTSLAASILLIYLVAFAIFYTGMPWAAAWGYTGLSALALAASRSDVRRLFAMPLVRRVTRLFVLLFLWNLLMLLVLRHYGGGLWGADWYEHFERAMFFVGRWPRDYEFINAYLLPARPPLMNLFSAFFLAQAGTQFPNFQLTFTFLNLLPFLSLVLLLSVLARGGSRRAGLLAVLLACNPMFLHNAQFTWTKSATGFFVALALWFYIVAWRRQDPLRMSLAFVSLAAATLVHYSGAPYAIAIGLHYVLWPFWRRRHQWKELVVSTVSSGALLATWVAYSVSIYGLRDTLTTNTAVTDSARMTYGENLLKIAANIVDTFIPHLARGQWLQRDDKWFRQVVDNAFHLYQVNLPLMFGVGGCLTVLFLIVRTATLPREAVRGSERTFWLVFTTVAGLLGIAAHGGRDVYGLGHIGLQPLVHVGLAWIAASMPRIPRGLRAMLVAGIALDLVFGVAIRVGLESTIVGWAVDYNFELKQKAGVTYLGDWMPAFSLPLQLVMWLVAAALLARIRLEIRRVPVVADGTRTDSAAGRAGYGAV